MKKPEQILKEAREKKGWTQTQLADQLGIGLRMYQKIEDGNFPKYKTDHVSTIDSLLGTSIYKIIYEQKGELKDDDLTLQEPKVSFLEKRRNKKNNDKQILVPLVPVKAQAGYVRAMDQSNFINTMDEYALPPGVDPMGAIWRYWEVEGDSMEPVFHNGDMILTSQVHKMDWENLRNFYLYVIVTAERVLFKRLYCKNELEWVLISENEDNYPQQLLQAEFVKEVWVYRRSIVNKAPPTKKFEIKV